MAVAVGTANMKGLPVKFVDNWRNAGKMLSVQVAGAAVLFGALPADQQSAVLALLGVGVERIPAIVGIAVILGRLIDQGHGSSA